MLGLTSICAPAYVYLIISLLGFILIAIYSRYNPSLSCAGSFMSDDSNDTMSYIIKILYVVFWGWVLNVLCEQGYSTVSWILVFLPFIIFALILGTIL